MPRYGRRRFARKPKRTYRKRNSRFRSRFSRRRGMSSMKSRVTCAPDCTFTKLKFYDSFLSVGPITPDAAIQNNFNNGRLVRGSDLYDPLSSKGSVQPSGFDQWCSQNGLYNNFLVHGCKIRYELVNMKTDQVLEVALYPVLESNAVLTNINGANQPYVSNALCGSGQGNNKIVLKKFMKYKKMVGVKDIVDYDDARGTYSSSPSTNWCWACDINPLGNTTDPTNFVVKREITYYVQFLARPVVVISTGV